MTAQQIDKEHIELHLEGHLAWMLLLGALRFKPAIGCQAGEMGPAIVEGLLQNWDNIGLTMKESIAAQILRVREHSRDNTFWENPCCTYEQVWGCWDRVVEAAERDLGHKIEPHGVL